MLVGLGIGVALVIIIFLLGPRVAIDTTLTPMHLPEDLDEYLAIREAAVANLVPGAEKTIVWAGRRESRTPLSLVYLHGFSATRQETAPLADTVAAALGANLFYTRLTGHGCGGEAMGEGSVQRWLNDVQEALAIGSRIGERVIVVGFSTGATIATWLASQPIASDVAAFVLLSPNYGLQDGRSVILTWPWGRELAELFIGDTYGWEPYNEKHRRYWTCRFPSRALLPMMAMVKLAGTSDLGAIRKPVLLLYSPEDQVVRQDRIKQVFRRIGSRTKAIKAVSGVGSPNHHVLAGDILAPGSTGAVADMILDFLHSACGIEQCLPEHQDPGGAGSCRAQKQPC